MLMIALPISAQDAYAISKSQLDLDSLITIGSGRHKLRDEIIFDIWKHFFKVLQKYRCVSSDECQECVRTMESFLYIIHEKDSISQFVTSFSRLSYSAVISGNLKIGLIQFLADLAPHYHLIKYVMASKRQNHEYVRSLDILWSEEIGNLNDSITMSEHIKKLEINELKKNKQENRTELQLHEGRKIPISEISQITEKIVKTK